MSLVTSVPEPNLWNEICKEHQARYEPVKNNSDDNSSVKTELEDYDPAKVTPVFYGLMYSRINTDCDILKDFNPARSHPASVGYAFVKQPEPSETVQDPVKPDKNSCNAQEYVEEYIMPTLMPALERMLKQAKEEKCFERRRTKFNPLDSLTDYLYNENETRKENVKIEFSKIPFVEEHWKKHPRPPLPMSLIWTEEEAAIIIQSFWRGYKVRCDEEVQELREWQRDWRERNRNVHEKVEKFWTDHKMPEDVERDDQGVEIINKKEEPFCDRVASSTESPTDLTPSNQKDQPTLKSVENIVEISDDTLMDNSNTAKITYIPADDTKNEYKGSEAPS